MKISKVGEPPHKEFIEYSEYKKSIFFSKSDFAFYGKKTIPSPSKIILNQIIKKYFGQSPRSIEKLGRATLHFIYKVKLKNKSYALKINKYAKYFKDLSFYNDLFSPDVKVHTIDTSRNIFPFEYEIAEFIEGQSLFDISKKKISNRKFIELLYKFGKEIGKLHQEKSFKYGKIDIESSLRQKKLVGSNRTWKEFVTQNLNSHIKFCVDKKIISKEDAEKISIIFKKQLKNINRFSPSLLHGDIANHNCIVTQKGNLFLIDWEDMLSGDPVYDIAYYCSGVYKNSGWIESFICGYKKVAKMPDDFELKYNLYFLRISIMKAIIRLKTNRVSEKQLPDIAKRIKYSLSKW